MAEIRDLAAEVLQSELQRNLLDPLPAGCEAGYMLYDALVGAGWTLVAPPGTPGICGRCRGMVAPGTTHHPFNGNQMFACEVSTPLTTV